MCSQWRQRGIMPPECSGSASVPGSCQGTARFPGRELQPALSFAFKKSQVMMGKSGRTMMGCGKCLKRPAIEPLIGCESLNYKMWQWQKRPCVCQALTSTRHAVSSQYTLTMSRPRAYSSMCPQSLCPLSSWLWKVLFLSAIFFFFNQLYCAFSLQILYDYQDRRPAARRKGKQLCLKLK